MSHHHHHHHHHPHAEPEVHHHTHHQSHEHHPSPAHHHVHSEQQHHSSPHGTEHGHAGAPHDPHHHAPAHPQHHASTAGPHHHPTSGPHHPPSHGGHAPQQHVQHHHPPPHPQHHAPPAGPHHHPPPHHAPPGGQHGHGAHVPQQNIHHYPMHHNHPLPHNFGPPHLQGDKFKHKQKMRNQHNVHYSNCTGNRKAVYIGINYVGSPAALKGCHNDARNIAAFLQVNHGFRRGNSVMLMDTPDASAKDMPTHANIMKAMKWLVQDAQPHDSLFFHYSGHGGLQKDANKQEGFDDTICPLDFKTKGQFIDDQIHDALVRPLPAGCRLTAIFDSCHSGTVMDLPYMYTRHGTVKDPHGVLAEAGEEVLHAAEHYAKGDLRGAFSDLSLLGKKVMNFDYVKAEGVRAARMSNANVIMWSGCKDKQTSTDANVDGVLTGAMTYAFISALKKRPHQTYMQLLNSIRGVMTERRYEQLPQLSCSHELNCNLRAIF